MKRLLVLFSALFTTLLLTVSCSFNDDSNQKYGSIKISSNQITQIGNYINTKKTNQTTASKNANNVNNARAAVNNEDSYRIDFLLKGDYEDLKSLTIIGSQLSDKSASSITFTEIPVDSKIYAEVYVYDDKNDVVLNGESEEIIVVENLNIISIKLNNVNDLDDDTNDEVDDNETEEPENEDNTGNVEDGTEEGSDEGGEGSDIEEGTDEDGEEGDEEEIPVVEENRYTITDLGSTTYVTFSNDVSTFEVLKEILTSEELVTRLATSENAILSLKDTTISALESNDDDTSIFTPFSSINLSESTTEIGANTFKDCDKLTTITSGASDIYNSQLISIGASAFESCTNLSSFYMPNVTRIGNYAFWNCTGLQEITIQPDVEIGTDSFDETGVYKIVYDLRNTTIFTESENPTMTCELFKNDGALTKISFKVSDITFINNANDYKTKMTYLGTDVVYKLQTHSFITATDLLTVTVVLDLRDTTGITEIKPFQIGENDASYFVLFTEVSLPNDTTKIYVNSFVGCSKLTSVKLNFVLDDVTYYWQSDDGKNMNYILNTMTSQNASTVLQTQTGITVWTKTPQ